MNTPWRPVPRLDHTRQQHPTSVAGHVSARTSVLCRGVGNVVQLGSTEEGWEVYRGPGAFGDVHGYNTQQLLHRHTVTLMSTWMFNCRLAQVHDDVQSCLAMPMWGHSPTHAAPSARIQEGMCPC